MRKKVRAVALHYDGESVPQVIAKGEGYLAKKIIATAKAHGIPLQQDEALTALLAKVHINEAIPESLFAAVAQVLAYLYYLNEQRS